VSSQQRSPAVPFVENIERGCAVCACRLHLVGAAVPSAFHEEVWRFGRISAPQKRHQPRQKWLIVNWEKTLYPHYVLRQSFEKPHLFVAQDWDIYDGSWSLDGDCVALNQVRVAPDSLNICASIDHWPCVPCRNSLNMTLLRPRSMKCNTLIVDTV